MIFAVELIFVVDFGNVTCRDIEKSGISYMGNPRRHLYTFIYLYILSVGGQQFFLYFVLVLSYRALQ